MLPSEAPAQLTFTPPTYVAIEVLTVNRPGWFTFQLVELAQPLPSVITRSYTPASNDAISWDAEKNPFGPVQFDA